MTREHYEKIYNGSEAYKHPKLCSFVCCLYENGIPLKLIDTNDWENSYKPSIYVHNKYNQFKIKRYSRCSEFDLINAIKFIKGGK